MRKRYILAACLSINALWGWGPLLFVASGCCKPFDPSTKQENEEARVWVTGADEADVDGRGLFARSNELREGRADKCPSGTCREEGRGRDEGESGRPVSPGAGHRVHVIR